MARCDECKYWDENELKKAEPNNFLIGLCTRVMPFWDATTWEGGRFNEQITKRVLLPEFADRRFFAQDGSDYRADVYTTPDFFCADFDAAVKQS